MAATSRRTGKSLCVFALLLCVFASAAVSAQPRVSFGKTQLDFGKVGQGRAVDLVFPYKNAGDAELTIGAIHTSCGCTNATATKRSLRPGESGEIQAKFNSGSFRGKITKTITVETNDPASKSVQLTVVGYVTPAVEVYPSAINFGTLKKGKTFRQTLILKPEDPSKFSVKSVEARAGFITVGNPVPSKQIKGGWEVHVTIDTADAKPGRVYEIIQIRTENPVQPIVVVRVMGTVSG